MAKTICIPSILGIKWKFAGAFGVLVSQNLILIGVGVSWFCLDFQSGEEGWNKQDLSEMELELEQPKKAVKSTTLLHPKWALSVWRKEDFLQHFTSSPVERQTLQKLKGQDRRRSMDGWQSIRFLFAIEAGALLKRKSWKKRSWAAATAPPFLNGVSNKKLSIQDD